MHSNYPLEKNSYDQDNKDILLRVFAARTIEDKSQLQIESCLYYIPRTIEDNYGIVSTGNVNINE